MSATDTAERNPAAENAELQGAGFAVTTAAAAGEALARIGREPFDLLVSDVGLPDGDGYEIMRHLRDRESQKIKIAPISSDNHPLKKSI